MQIHKVNEVRFGSHRRLRLCESVIIFVCCAAVQSFSQDSDPESRLRERMTAYWNAMQAGQFDIAVQFIHPDHQRQFTYEIPKSRVLKWVIKELRFNKEKTACDTVTVVTKPMPPLGMVADIPLSNQWLLLADGQWYFKIPWNPGENPMLKAFMDKEDLQRKLPRTESEKAAGETATTPPRPPSRLIPDPANPTSVRFGEKHVFRFSYRNDQPHPIKILSAHSDCHCTAVGSDFPEVPPGGSGTLEVTLDTFGLPLGSIRKDILVEFSDLDSAMVLTMSVDNLPNFEIEPASIDFGALVKGIEGKAQVRLVNRSGKTVNLLSALKSDPRLRVDMETTRLEPGQALTITLHYLSASEGIFLDNLLLRTDLEAEPLLTIAVRGSVSP